MGLFDRTPTTTSSGPCRRRVLTTLAVGAAVEFRELCLPHRWSRPLVDAVVLPAHAQTSADEQPPSPVVSCSPDPFTVDNTVQDGDAQGHIAIIYDGADSCSLIQVITDSADGGASGDPDEMLLIDADGNPVTDFDLRGPNYGANWGPGPERDDNLSGNYSFDIERVASPNDGATFRVEFQVSFDGSEMTVSNVQISML